ncbi:MAG: tRNA (guanosine(37)-N1)-methyltransferase TrmD [Gammaproteobacteria bacterium]|nr:tRNA (guanosine(37)-N1)-methyltransferase TrmD [Gammaproteobacteria bacterium]
MRIGIVTLFPAMFEALRCCGITGRAIQQGRVSLTCWNPRDLATDAHRTVDDRPYGGGPGMVMRYEPLASTIRAARRHAGGKASVIYLTPQGRRLEQQGVVELATRKSIVLVAGRYEGIDERVVESEIDEEWSIGDYVLSGGELAAMVMVDAIIRLQPGTLGDQASACADSFFDGLLDWPHYTRPEEIGGRRVPEVLLGGNHQAIRRWRLRQALGRTWKRRRDLLEKLTLDAEQQALLDEFIRERDEI